ncbi:DUF5060 domain-containing protein [Negadavirga shengliensis]|uniref:DUF5060 domain-containing protein n=1 Tax=Negadavirga shengliensis TaxID=1389218 RepID=A0ABV9SX94_9BACT
MSCGAPQTNQVEQWDVFEAVFEGPDTGNPFLEVDLKAVFVNGSDSVTVPGFYDGEGIYRIRFSPETQGEWSYRTESNIAALHNKKGTVRCSIPTGENHGPLKITNTFYLQYADGTPYYGIGTTAYQWTSVKPSIQNKTVQTLASSPFNKVRMCVFPKSYQYGNDTEPWTYPFKREGEQSDFGQPNVEFFQNFDNRIKQLLDLGIQADVILFHPYDRWGYCQMGTEINERYVRYMIARISAFRNVWWSLANEWDIPEIKETIDWEGIGTLLQNEDPHQRFRGIHNWYGSEDHFYDHSRPWITHTSTQTSQFYNAIRWREKYKKPLLFDEMRYEGDVASGWGNLSGEEMASYFWMAGLSGGYPTHGDTYRNDSDNETEVRWWAKGGTLPGESSDRIAYFKSIMEEMPVHEMAPSFYPAGDEKELNQNVYVLSKAGEIYLAYIAEPGQTVDLDLTGTEPYSLDAIDTWNMAIMESTVVNPGKFTFTATRPYTALRLWAK